MPSPSALQRDRDALLRRFAAAQTLRPDAPFRFLPIKDYAFAWILHPGFDDGTRMSGLLILSELEQAGLIAFEDDGFPARQTAFLLTEAGMSYETEAQLTGQQADTGSGRADAERQHHDGSDSIADRHRGMFGM